MPRDLAALEKRVLRLEQDLAMVRLEIRRLAASARDADAAEIPPEPEPEPESESESAPAFASPAPAPTALPISPPPVVSRPADAPAPAAHRVPNAGPPAARPSLERRIGGQIFAIAGALIVIIGLGLAVKVAIDSGWFRLFPPAVRCVAIAGLGVCFLGVGEFLRTRVRPIAIAGCNAVGIAALYIAAYAAFGVFGLIAAPVAFGLMALSAAVGLSISLRHGFLSTGLLSLVGAYLVPILLAQPDASPYVLPMYVLLLSTVALTLAAARPRPFAPMRDAAWIGAGLLGLAWTLAEIDGSPWLVLTFWAAAWGLHQAELLVTAGRDQLSPREPDQPRPRPAVFRRRVEPVLLAIATTAVVVAIAAITLDAHLGLPAWLAPAAGLAVTSAIALVHGGHLRVLRDKPRSDIETLAAAHAAQAGALLVATIALALQGWVEATAWLAMGVGAVLAGRWIAARSLEVYGVVLLSIATARIATYDLFVGSAATPWTSDSPLALAPWTVLILAAGAAWMLAAILMLHTSRDGEGRPAGAPRPIASALCAALAVACLLFAPAHPESTAGAICLAWVVLSLFLRCASGFEPRLRLAEFSLLAAAGAILPWSVAMDAPAWLRSTAAVGAYPGLWQGGAIAAACCAHAWADRRRAQPTAGLGPAWPALLSIGAGVALVATSFEVARSASMLAADDTARRAALSIWWGLWGVSAVFLGFGIRTAPVRYVGLALMSVAAFKAVLLDLAGVPPLWRVASFVGLGALMLGVAILYNRVSATLSAEATDRAPE